MAQSKAGSPYIVDDLAATALWRIHIYGEGGAVISWVHKIESGFSSLAYTSGLISLCSLGFPCCKSGRKKCPQKEKGAGIIVWRIAFVYWIILHWVPFFLGYNSLDLTVTTIMFLFLRNRPKTDLDYGITQRALWKRVRQVVLKESWFFIYKVERIHRKFRSYRQGQLHNIVYLVQNKYVGVLCSPRVKKTSLTALK